MRVYSNIASSTALTAAVAAGDAVLPVGDTTGWPVPLSGQEALAAIDYGSGTVELVTYTGLTANSLTGVVRGLDGTAAQAHASGAAVQHVMSASDIQLALRVTELQPGLLSGAYYQSQFATSQGVTGLTNNNLRAAPFTVFGRTSFSGLVLEVTTAGPAGAAMRLGIYADDGTGYPGALILDAGTVLADSTGFKEIAITQALARGLYWLVAVGEVGGISVRGLAAPSFSIVPQSNSAGAAQAAGWSVGGGTGGLPAMYPAGGGALSNIPRILIKVA